MKDGALAFAPACGVVQKPEHYVQFLIRFKEQVPIIQFKIKRQIVKEQVLMPVPYDICGIGTLLKKAPNRTTCPAGSEFGNISGFPSFQNPSNTKTFKPRIHYVYVSNSCLLTTARSVPES